MTAALGSQSAPTGGRCKAPFGMRFDLRNPGFAGVDMATRYEAALEMIAWADERGGMSVILSEHHGADDGYLPSVLVMAAAVAARTRNIRIAINCLVAPFHDPLRLAEDTAVVDLISRGRLDLTIGAGYVRDEFELFGVPMAERPARVCETVETLRAAWTGEPFTYHGRTARLTPRPAQPGGPRIMLGGSSDAAARRAARIADGFVPADDRFWPTYRDECIKLGRPDPGPGPGSAISVVILAEDPEAAWTMLAPFFMHESNSYAAWQAQAGVDWGYQHMQDVQQLRAAGQYRILTPDDYAAELRAAGDAAFALLHPMVGGIPPELAWEHMRLFERSFLSSGEV